MIMKHDNGTFIQQDRIRDHRTKKKDIRELATNGRFD